MSVAVRSATTTPYYSSASGSLATTVPSGTTNGDVLYALVGLIDSGTLTPPAGAVFTQLGSTVDSNGMNGYLYRRQVQTGDPSSYSWSASGSGAFVVSYVCVRGADLNSPEDVAIQSSTVYSTTLTMPTITTAAPGDLILYLLVGYGNGSLSGTGLTVDTQDSGQRVYALHQTTNVSNADTTINTTITDSSYTNQITAFAVAVRNSGAQPQYVNPTVTISTEPYCIYGDTVAVTATATAGSGTINAMSGYAWSFQSKPAGSNATFSGQGTPNVTFVADAEGSFVPQCVVTDSDSDHSPAATATVISNAAIHVVLNGILKPATINTIVH